MHSYCIYVFDSSTANEAALAVKEGQYENIIQYHNTKHQHMKPPLSPNHNGSLPAPMQNLQSHHLMAGPPAHPHDSPSIQYSNHVQPSHPSGMHQKPYDPNLPSHRSQDMESKLERLGRLAQMTTQPPPPNIHQQPFESNLSIQKIHDKETKLERLGQLAQMTTQPPPPALHQMTPTEPSSIEHAGHPPVGPPIQQLQQPMSQVQPTYQHIKQEQGRLLQQQQSMHLDPLSSMAALSECPNMGDDGFGHTVHHR